MTFELTDELKLEILSDFLHTCCDFSASFAKFSGVIDQLSDDIIEMGLSPDQIRDVLNEISERLVNGLFEWSRYITNVGINVGEFDEATIRQNVINAFDDDTRQVFLDLLDGNKFEE